MGKIHNIVGTAINITCFHRRLEMYNKQKVTINSTMFGRVIIEIPQINPTHNQEIRVLLCSACKILQSRSKLKNISNGTASSSSSKYITDPHVEYIAVAILAVFVLK